MSILSSIYSSTTSLMSFSKALDLVSDNVANLNTIGFRASDPLFASLPGAPDARDAHAIGEGTQFVSAGRRYLAGETRQTGNVDDLAINGEGFFVLSRDGALQFTRFGQFQLSADRRLIDPLSGAVLQGISGGGLVDLIVDLDRVNPSSPTSRVAFGGSLSSADDSHVVSNINVVDKGGQSHVLTMTLTKDPAPIATEVVWNVEVKDASGAVISPPASVVKFSSFGGRPLAGFNTLELAVGQGESRTVAVLDFGDPNAAQGGVESIASGASAVRVSSFDGYPVGAVSSHEFDANGALTLKFSNGQSAQTGQVALASFSNPQLLRSEDGRLFTATSDTVPIVGIPGNGALGTLLSKNVELANVELAKEFSDIIILQRGYQASSQILNVSSEMLQDVYSAVNGRG